MSKRARDASEKEGPPMNRSAGPPGWVVFLNFAGIAAVLAVSTATWQEMRSDRKALGDRLGALETRLTQISAKVDAVGARTPPPQRGPDPNKVYAVKTDGAPAKGPREAPIVIAEFSDFQ